MAAPTKDELAKQIAHRIGELEVALSVLRVSHDHQLKNPEAQLAERVRLHEQLQKEHVELSKTVTALNRDVVALSNLVWRIVFPLGLAIVVAVIGAFVNFFIPKSGFSSPTREPAPITPPTPR